MGTVEKLYCMLLAAAVTLSQAGAVPVCAEHGAENGTEVWDFAEFTEEAAGSENSGGALTYDYNGLTLSIADNNDGSGSYDRITTGGIYWRGAPSDGETVRYIAYTPETDGTLYAEGKLNASGGRWGISDSRDVASFSAEHSTTSTDTQTESMECAAGTEYYIYAKAKSATVTRVTYVSDAAAGPTEETEPTEEPEQTAEPTEETKPETDSSADTAPDAPSGLLTNELEEPLNVDTAYFGWLVNDADENDYQSAYRIIVTDDLSGETVWDSGKTESSEQSYIECGAELEPGHPYSWKVKIWDSTGLESEFSEEAHFASGLDTDDWDASWISSGGSGSNHYWYARYERELDGSKTVAKALAYIAGVHDYELNVNGTYIGRGQSFDYASETRYQGWDITDAVKNSGTAAVGLLNRYYGAGQGRAASCEALLVHINIFYTDGTADTIVTDGDWKVSETVPLSGSSKRNGEGDFIEEYDARNEQTGYSEPGFDDSGWSGAEVIGEHPTDEFTSVTPELSKVTDYIVYPVSVTELSDGTTVVDFGKVIPARPLITFKNGKAGTKLTIRTGYELNADGSIDSSSASTQSTDMTYRYTQKDGEQTYGAWDHLGFRYISIPECGEEFTADTIAARVVHTNVPEGRGSTFVSSDEMLNDVYELMQRSALYSIQNGFVDTPTREKGQFLQDSINISDASTTTLYERAASKKAIDQFLASADRYWIGGEAGRYNSVYPNGDGKRDIPDFTINLPYWVWSYYMQTGDRATLEKAYPYIKATADYISGYIDDTTGLVTKLGGGDGSPNSYQYGIVDWPSVGRFGYDWSGTKNGARTTVNMLSKRAFDVIALAAAELGNEGDAEDMAARSAALKSAINERLINSDGVYCDGLDGSGNQVSNASQHVSSYALAFDVAPEDMKAELAEYIAGMGMKQGPMTADILVKALFAGGETAAALKLLTEPNDNGWAKEIAKGYTFTWEAWNANTSENSQSHGWGSAAAKDILANFAGVMVTAPGAEKVRIAPAYCSLTSLDASVSTERGNVRVSYSRSETDFDVTVTVPSNVTAEIVLPRLGEGEFARVNGAQPDSSLTETEQVFTVGGGTYEFTYSGEISVLPDEPVYNEPLPEGITGTDDAGIYTWAIGAADPAETAGTIYEDKNDIAELSVSLGRGDYLDEGIVFTVSSVKEPNTSGQASLADTKRYIAVQPKKDGTFSLTAAFDRAGSSSKDRIYYADLGEGAELASSELSQYYKVSHMTAGADITSTGETVRTIDMTAGHTYIIYTYQYGSRITALSYTYTDTPAPATAAPATAAPATDAPATTAPATAAPATAAPENTPEAAEGLRIISRAASDGRIDYRLGAGADGGVVAAAAYAADGTLYSVTAVPVSGDEVSVSVKVPREMPVRVKFMLWDSLAGMKPLSAALTDEYTGEVSAIRLDRSVYPLVVGSKSKTDFSDWEPSGSSFTLNAEVSSYKYDASGGAGVNFAVRVKFSWVINIGFQRRTK